MTDSEPVAISIPEAARRLGVSATHLYAQTRGGKFFPAYRLGGRWLVSVEALARWNARQTERAERAERASA